MNHVNDKKPNFHGDDGQFFLVRCFACGGECGKENWGCAVATGCCAFCGWHVNVVVEPNGIRSMRPADKDFEDSVRRKRDDQLRGMFS